MCGNSNNSSSGSAFKYGFIGFILGAAAGAIAALFLTTKTGFQLREEIKSAVADIQKKVEEKASKIKDITKEKYEELIDSALNAYNKAKKFTEKEIELIRKILIEKRSEKEEDQEVS